MTKQTIKEWLKERGDQTIAEGRVRMDDGEFIDVLKHDCVSFNILTVTAGVSEEEDDKAGYQTYINIFNNEGTQWDVEANDLIDRGLTICTRGYSELCTMIEALRFAADVLESRKEILDER